MNYRWYARPVTVEPQVENQAAGRVDATAEEIAAVRAVAMLARFAERTLGDVSLAHYRLLSGIAEGHERASRLASKLALGKPAISASVDALGRAGLISRAAVVGDQRASALALTPAGRAVLDNAERELVAALRAVVADPDGTIVQALAAIGAALEAEHRARDAAAGRQHERGGGRPLAHSGVESAASPPPKL
jgi:DNA-binding MarR family transcriptional regulator